MASRDESRTSQYCSSSRRTCAVDRSMSVRRKVNSWADTTRKLQGSPSPRPCGQPPVRVRVAVPFVAPEDRAGLCKPSAAARRRRRRSDDREPPPHRRPVRVAPVPVGPGAQRDLPPAATGERDARPPVDARPEEMEVVDARAVTDDEDMPAVLYATNDRPVCSLERNRGARSDRPVERPRVRSGRGQQREDGEYTNNHEDGVPVGHQSLPGYGRRPRPDFSGRGLGRAGLGVVAARAQSFLTFGARTGGVEPDVTWPYGAGPAWPNGAEAVLPLRTARCRPGSATS